MGEWAQNFHLLTSTPPHLHTPTQLETQNVTPHLVQTQDGVSLPLHRSGHPPAPINGQRHAGDVGG